jgi:hypothetical protein
MIVISELGMNASRRVIATVDDFKTAKARVEAMGVVLIEDDNDYAYCADAFLKDGRVLSIQPANFKL